MTTGTSKARSRRSLAQKGGALLAVLWLSAGLAAVAFAVSSTVRSETDRVSTAADGLRAHYLAEGAVERGILWLNWGYGNIPSLKPDGTPRFWTFNQPRMTMSFPSGDAIVEVIPESAKLDVNRSTPDDLYRVVLSVTGDPNRARQITGAIIDWRTPSPGPTALDSYYLGLGPTFRPRHASIQEIEELLSVQGMSAELFYGNYVPDAAGRLYARGGLRDCLSPWGSSGPFDVNTASPALLEAFAVPPDIATAIIARRQTQPFAKTQELREILPGNTRVTVGGGLSTYTLRATARLRLKNGALSDVVRTAGATVKLQDQRKGQLPPVILRWYDDAWSQAIIAPYPGMPAPGGNTPGVNPGVTQ